LNVAAIIEKLPFAFNYVKKNGCVSIHVRRGDYLIEPEFPVLGIYYYYQAISFFIEKGYTKFFVFSDDIPWCRHNINSELYKGCTFEYSENNNMGVYARDTIQEAVKNFDKDMNVSLDHAYDFELKSNCDAENRNGIMYSKELYNKYQDLIIMSGSIGNSNNITVGTNKSTTVTISDHEFPSFKLGKPLVPPKESENVHKQPILEIELDDSKRVNKQRMTFTTLKEYILKNDIKVEDVREEIMEGGEHVGYHFNGYHDTEIESFLSDNFKSVYELKDYIINVHAVNDMMNKKVQNPLDESKRVNKNSFTLEDFNEYIIEKDSVGIID